MYYLDELRESINKQLRGKTTDEIAEAIVSSLRTQFHGDLEWKNVGFDRHAFISHGNSVDLPSRFLKYLKWDIISRCLNILDMKVRDKRWKEKLERKNEVNDLVMKDISAELWREYDFSDRVYRIDNPKTLYYRHDGTTHRVVDSEGVVHCVPVPGEYGCILRWQNKNGCKEVNF